MLSSAMSFLFFLFLLDMLGSQSCIPGTQNSSWVDPNMEAFQYNAWETL